MSKFVNNDIFGPTINVVMWVFVVVGLIAAAGNYYIVVPFKRQVQLDRQNQQICQQICGEYLVLRCNAEHDIIVCDPATRVQHFPK